MSASILLKFVNPKAGPIISISSTPYPNFWRRGLWHSTAQLHPDWNPGSPAKIFGACGGGWSPDKEQSQCKAVTEAIERWAYRYYSRFSPDTAGFDMDPTSNGFAALPHLLGKDRLIMNAYCEALERWALNRICDRSGLKLYDCLVEDNNPMKLFAGLKGRLHCLGANLLTRSSGQLQPREVVFYLCIFETMTGGAIPGSACGEHALSTMGRALSETFINVMAFNRMKKRKLTAFEDILEQRLYHFGNSMEGYAAVMRMIKKSNSDARHRTPEIIFSKGLDGPWNPEVLVHRVLVKDSKPVTTGGIDRFLI